MTERVVISGAGPNGLVLACELALAGLEPVVLDRLAGPSSEPKANGLVGQVIRQLDMRGLHTRISGDSQPPRPAFGWMFAGLSLSFLDVADNPLYSVLIQQPRLVRLLDERARELGVDVRWGHELEAFTASPDAVSLTVRSAGGTYRLDAEWLVGADGGRSMVRKSSGIGFPGHTAPITSRIAHVHLPGELLVAGRGYELPGYGLLPFGTNRFPGGHVVFFPLEADRPLLGTVEYGAAARADGPMTFDELRTSLRRLIDVEVPISAPRGSGVHALRRIDQLNSRHADAYRRDRVLLVGDAAHVCSPMGGPGLNLGMQDAMNLGWKLAAVIAGRAPDGFLDTYEAERRPVADRVLMHSQAQLALAAPGPEVDSLRTLFAELTRLPAVATHLAGLLAGSDVRYDVGDDHPLSGRLFPDLELDDGRRVADLLHAGRPVLLDLTGLLAVTHPGVEVVTAVTSERPAAALLIRPDGYVAWAADDVESGQMGRLREALARWCGTNVVTSAP